MITVPGVPSPLLLFTRENPVNLLVYVLLTFHFLGPFHLKIYLVCPFVFSVRTTFFISVQLGHVHKLELQKVVLGSSSVNLDSDLESSPVVTTIFKVSVVDFINLCTLIYRGRLFYFCFLFRFRFIRLVINQNWSRLQNCPLILSHLILLISTKLFLINVEVS